MAKIATAAAKRTFNRLSSGTDPRREIEKLAYQFFIQRGCQHGFDREDWLRAEAIVKSRRFD